MYKRILIMHFQKLWFYKNNIKLKLEFILLKYY